MPNQRRRDAGRPRGAFIEGAILDATLEDLAAHGVDGISVERIAAAAEVNKTTVYRRYQTTDALVSAAMQRAVEASATAPIDHGSLRADLRALVEEHATLLSRPEGQALVRIGISPGVAALARDAGPVAAGPLPSALEGVLDRAVERAELRSDVDRDVLASLLGGAVIHRVLLMHAEVDDQWVDELVELLARAVVPPG